MNKMIGIHAIISGKVQGVFFRLETQKAAEKLGITGWVRNLPTGEVEAVFESDQATLEKMIQWCHKGSPGSMVSHVRTEPVEKPEGFSSFEVRY